MENFGKTSYLVVRKIVLAMLQTNILQMFRLSILRREGNLLYMPLPSNDRTPYIFVNMMAL